MGLVSSESWIFVSLVIAASEAPDSTACDTSISTRFTDDLEESGDFCVFWSLLRAELHKHVRCLAMDGELTTVRLSSYFDIRYIFQLAFQCYRFKVNQHPVEDVMSVLLRSGQSALREEAVENRNCRFYYCSQKTDKSFSSVSGTYILVPETTMKREFIGPSKKEPADSRTIRKSTREESIDTLQATTIDNMNQKSIDTDHLTSIYIVHPMSIDTAHQPSIDIIHLPSDTTCLEAGKVEVLILKVNVNGMLRDEEGRTRNIARQLINVQGQDPFQGLPHQDPKNQIEELEDLMSRSEQNEGSEYHMLWKIFPYSISGDAFRWFSQLQPGSLTSWDDIERAFLYKFLDDDKWDRFLASLDEESMIPIQLLDDIMAKRDEQHGFREPSKVEEADTSDPASSSIDSSTSESIDIGTSETIDTDFYHRSIPLEIPERSCCPQDTADSTHKNIDISSCDPTSDGDRKITIDDFLELEEFLELEDGEKLEDLDSSREVTIEDFLELEEWLEDMDHNLKKKLDDDQHTSRGDLETSKANIDRQQPDEIDRQKPHIIDLHPPDIDRHRQPIIDRHHPPNIDICPLMDDPPGCTVELEHIEERMNMSKASHLDVLTHQRPPFWIEEAAGFHKRVKRIYDPMKIVVSYVVFEVESPIPPDRSMHFSSFIGGWKNHHAIRQVWGKEEEELEEEKKDQGQFSVFIDSLLLRWCQEIQSAQQMHLTSICKASSTPSC
ncbi:hypothetical protein IGI04_023705 [Brassica rapa subsp. trilocularis]|uniref:Retrotransposon gag domain-containing protein n=1 Tax=Brassica rapa subsp. trilocularis TaxID=1813537 RepID=A0ABQ7M4N0_BRACM|nr:hypothetical protein IGI04_023705 [Brassica rapa subsp. trilocularis]